MGLSEDIQQKRFESEFSKVIVNIIFTNNWIREKHMRLFKPHGLTEPQYNVLRILRGQYPNTSTIRLIIERMLNRVSNASRIVDKLEEKGLIKRSQCEHDHRAVDVIITNKGLELLAELDSKLSKWHGMTRNLSEKEAGQLNELLDKLRASN